jgi:4-amino-4-deoxy-L-arabinose transferase-like glycosyltransferase
VRRKLVERAVQVAQTIVERPGAPVVNGQVTRAMWLLLAGCVALFVVLRARWVGHLLVWDEAMALCTARSFIAGADDPFAAWFWRHPPLHSVLLLALSPLQPGFAERAEILSITIAVINQLLLFQLNRRVFGAPVGLWSAFIIALLPASMFYDVWIKQDHPVVTFGLLALLALQSRRFFLSGLCLGLALLSKATAAFYCLGVFLLWLGGACGKRSIKDIAVLIGTSAITCGWWYLIVVPRERVPGSTDVFKFAASSDALWQSEWFFYFARLPRELGWLALGLTVIGTVFLIRKGIRENAFRLWALAVLVPALLLIMLVPNKVPWIVIALLPAWATLAAVAAAAMMRSLPVAETSRLRPAITALFIAAVATVTLGLSRRDYESALRRFVEAQWRGAANSREAAGAVNAVVNDGDRMLLTSFYYWKGLPEGLPDPVFTYYVVKKPVYLVRSHKLSFAQLLSEVRQHRLDWALISPEPENSASIIKGLQQRLGLIPAKATTGALLYRTSVIYESAAQPQVPIRAP